MGSCGIHQGDVVHGPEQLHDGPDGVHAQAGSPAAGQRGLQSDVGRATGEHGRVNTMEPLSSLQVTLKNFLSAVLCFSSHNCAN